MITPQSAKAQEIAQAAVVFETQRTGHAPESVTVVMTGETIVITLHGALTLAERNLAQDPAGAAKVQEFHRQLFADASASFKQEIRRITGVDVREAAAEVDPATGMVVGVFSSGTAVQVFLMSQEIPAGSWSGNDPGVH